MKRSLIYTLSIFFAILFSLDYIYSRYDSDYYYSSNPEQRTAARRRARSRRSRLRRRRLRRRRRIIRARRRRAARIRRLRAAKRRRMLAAKRRAILRERAYKRRLKRIRAARRRKIRSRRRLEYVYVRKERESEYYRLVRARRRRVRPQGDLKKVRIVHMSISNYYFRSGQKLKFTIYVENRNRYTLRNVRVSFYIHKKGKVSPIPIKYMDTVLAGNKISRFDFEFIWKETGYTTNYYYKHGDYRFEGEVKHKGKTVKLSHVIWAHPYEYMFYWTKPW